MQFDGQDMIGPLFPSIKKRKRKNAPRYDANEYRKNPTPFYAPISVMQMWSTPVGGGRGRIACQ